MLTIAKHLVIPENEILIQAIRSSGAGGQNVNKVSSAIHLQFDIRNSSLPRYVKERLLSVRDSRIDKAGIIHIKSQEHRTQERNKQAALDRLRDLIVSASEVRKKRISTKVPKQVKRKRLDQKRQRGELKSLRRKTYNND